MGTVWLAERSDGLLARQVALKLPHLMGERRAISQRFARERHILAGLAHPNIARLYDAGVSVDGRPYLALEYVQGQTLTDYCDANRLGVRERVSLFLQVLEAVRFAHAHLVIHRDLKPSNLLVDGEGRVQLLDFGIAKLLEVDDAATQQTALTQLGGVALTPQYASPEQILGKPIGTACDIYSLGVVLFELLAGSTPYRLKRNTRLALEEAIVAAEPARPSTAVVGNEAAAARGTSARRLARQLQGDLDTIVLKALKKDPGQRYPSVESFALDLRAWLDGRAVQAQPDSAWYRGRKFLARNWLVAGATATVICALGLGLGVALWQARVARDEARTATAVKDFLRDIFQANSANQADPQRARNTTARELLDTAVGTLDSTLADAPEAKVQILKTLGQLYVELGLNAQAADLHRKRIRVAQEVYGNNSAEVVDALLDLAYALNTQLDNPDWDKALKEAGAILDRRGDTGSLLRAKLFSRIADYYQESDLPKAGDYVERSISIYRKYPPSKEFVSTLFSGGMVSMVSGKYLQSRKFIEEAIATCNGPIALACAEFLPNLYGTLGEVMLKLGDLAGAEENLRKGWELASKINGDDNVDTISNLAEYAHLLVSTGRSGSDGIEKLTAALNGLNHAKAGADAAYQWMVLTRYGMDAANYGRIEEGLAVLQRLEGTLDSASDSARLLAVKVDEADIFVTLGSYTQARTSLGQASAMLDSPGVPKGRAERLIQRVRLKLALAQGQTEDAKAIAATLPLDKVEMAEQVSDGLIDRYLQAQQALATGNFNLAKNMAQEGISFIDANVAKAYLAVAEQRFRLLCGLALASLRNPQAAEPMLRNAVAIGNRVYDPVRSPELALAQIALARSLMDLKRPDEARLLATKARAIYATHKRLGDQYTRSLRDLNAQLGSPVLTN